MAFAINPKEPQVYILKEDRNKPKEEQTLFYIMFPKVQERIKADDASIRFENKGKRTIQEIKLGTQRYMALQTGFVRWENFKIMENGEVKDLKWDGGRKEEMFEFLNPKHAAEIADYIRGIGEVEEGE